MCMQTLQKNYLALRVNRYAKICNGMNQMDGRWMKRKIVSAIMAHVFTTTGIFLHDDALVPIFASLLFPLLIIQKV